MDILNQLRHGGGLEKGVAYDSEGPSTNRTSAIPLTVSELLDSQIKWHEAKIKTLREAKAAISPDVERALNALAKL